MAILIKADGQEQNIQPDISTMTYLELQKVVGGYLQMLYTDDGRIMYVNEDAKMLNLAINRKATDLISPDRYRGLPIRGDVIVCETEEARKTTPPRRL